MIRLVHRLIFCLSSVLVSGQLLVAQSGRIVEMVANADTIFVGNATGHVPRSNGDSLVSFRIGRVLKGKARVGELISGVFVPEGREGRARVALPEWTALVFLNHDAGSGEARMLQSDYGGLGIAGGMIDIGGDHDSVSPVAASVPVSERVFGELISAVERRASDERYLIGEASLLDVDRSPLVKTTLKKWLGGRNRNLAMLAAGLLFHTGDSAELKRLHSELKANPRDRLAIRFGTALSSYRGEDPAEIALIGGLATDPVQDRSVRNAASRALAAVHNEQTLRFLYEMLKSPDRDIRQDAVMGFTRFVLRIRVVAVGDNSGDALDEMFNPGRQTGQPRSPYDNAETRKFAVLDRFRDEVDENRRIDFWRGWFEADARRLSGAQ